MLQKGSNPSLAIPPEKVTACPSAMPTSNARSGIAFIKIFIEQPVGMAGVTPIILSFFFASSSKVLPNTSWNKGGIPLVSFTILSPVSLSNMPGACQMVAASSAGLNPLPLIVWI